MEGYSQDSNTHQAWPDTPFSSQFASSPLSFLPPSSFPPPAPLHAGPSTLSTAGTASTSDAGSSLFLSTSRLPPYQHRRTSSLHSLTSSAFSSDSEPSPHSPPQPKPYQLLDSAPLGAHRRTPAYRSTRDNSGPYSRRSSLAGEDDHEGVMGDVEPLGVEERLSRMMSEEALSFEDEKKPFAGGGGGGGGGGGIAPAFGAFSAPVIPRGEYQKSHEVEQAVAAAAGVLHSATTATATDKAKTAFVQTWLTKSYEIVEGSTIARQALYGSYARASEKQQVKPLNSASFGKALRVAFPSIKTRRLGTRGHSRYHLMNLRASNAVEAALVAQIDEELKSGGGGGGDTSSDAGTSSGAEDARSVSAEDTRSAGEGEEEEEVGVSRRNTNPRRLSISIPPGNTLFDEQKTLVGGGTAVPGILAIPQLALPPPPPPPPTYILPPAFPQVDHLLQQTGDGGHALRALWDDFSAHCASLLATAKEQNFGALEQQILVWWRSRSATDALLIQHPVVIPLICRGQALVYEEILIGLHKSVEVPFSAETVDVLQSLANRMESIHAAALAGYTEQAFVLPSVELSARFSHILHHALGLKKLAQALKGILAKPAVEGELAHAWLEVDFSTIKKHGALACHLDIDLLDSAIRDFGTFLLSSHPLTVGALLGWLESRFDEHAHSVASPRALLMKFDWVSGQIMRDLTLRSSPAFGTFQVLSLLLQDVLSFRTLLQTALHVDPVPPASHTIPQPAPSLPYPHAAFDSHPPPPPQSCANNTTYLFSAPPSSSNLSAPAPGYGASLSYIPNLNVAPPPPFPSPSSSFFF